MRRKLVIRYISLSAKTDNGFQMSKQWDTIDEAVKELLALKSMGYEIVSWRDDLYGNKK